jgi:hypothetical protein
VWLCHAVFIYSLIDGHKVMKFLYNLLFEHRFSVFLHIYQWVKLLGSMIVLCLAFWETSKLFPPVTAPFYISTTALPTLVLLIVVFLLGMKWYLIGLFSYLHFPNDQRCWASFHVFISYLYVFLGKESTQLIHPFSFCIYSFIFPQPNFY